MMVIRWIGLAVLVASFALAEALPVWTSFENGPVENTQVVVLLIGAAFAWAFGRKGDGAPRSGWFWAATVPVWITMVLRELSWGAVFLTPLAVTAHGPQFSSDLLWYKPYVTPVLQGILVLVVASFLYGRGLQRLGRLIMARRFPLWDLALFVLAMLVSTAAEGHMGLSLPAFGDGQVTEETSELAGYLFLLSAQCRVFMALRGEAGGR